jgi:suppressor for copper-sensitivity B
MTDAQRPPRPFRPAAVAVAAPAGVLAAVLAAALAAAAPPAVAASLSAVPLSVAGVVGPGDRVDLPSGTLRLQPGAVNGATAELGLTLALKPGWKTYWRTPGDAGIPPRIDLGATAVNVAGLDVAYPAPHRFGAADAPSLGYSGTVTLPLTVHLADPARPARVVLSVMLGVCRDICVPVTEEIVAEIVPGASGAASAVIAAARRAVPHPVAAGAPLSVVALSRADAADPVVLLDIDPGPDGPVGDVFVEAGDDWVLPQPTRVGDVGGRSRWRVVLADAPAGRPVAGAELTVTILGAGRATEQRVTVPAR